MLASLSPRAKVVLACLLALALTTGAALRFHPKLNSRVALIASKLWGANSEFSWAQVSGALVPSRFKRERSPYLSTKNHRTSADDVAAGAGIFRTNCARCHGDRAQGGAAPSLATGEFSHGASDLALFESISNGISGTEMEGTSLLDKEVWQVVGYLRTLSEDRTSSDEYATSDVGEATSVHQVNVRAEDLLSAAEYPNQWLMYSGGYQSHRYSALEEISSSNVWQLQLDWVHQMPTDYEKANTTPLVVNDVMFLTESPSNAVALDATTGTTLWRYERSIPAGLPLCCGRVNRGLAILGDRLYLGTVDGYLIALDALTGLADWEVKVADFEAGYSITSAPLALSDKVIVGVAGGEFGAPGFLDAYDAGTGTRIWRFETIPGPGEPGHGTWQGDSWKTGGAATWLTGSFDPDLGLAYWGVGNPSPNFDGTNRDGDNLYSNSVVALDSDTGELQWFFQFTPHDLHDWDSNQIPVLVDTEFQGRQRKLMLWANRNAFFYVLDRETGEFLLARPFSKQTWAERIDAHGRPVKKPGTEPSPRGNQVFPGVFGATNWWSPSYSPATGLLYVPVMEWGDVYFSRPETFSPGRFFEGGSHHPVTTMAQPSVKAILPQTGEVRWERPFPQTSMYRRGGVLSTAGSLVFADGSYGRFVALDAATGEELWQARLGASINASPISYRAGDRQRVTIASGKAVFTFSLDEAR